jgi:predicted TIM-barrel fold metal-dependent hydrolase
LKIARLTDTSRRLELMDQREIDLAVLSNGAVVQGSLEPQAALRMAREANDHLAEVVRARPDRFAAFATTPLQHPEEGADELQRAVEQLGLAGSAPRTSVSRSTCTPRSARTASCTRSTIPSSR